MNAEEALQDGGLQTRRVLSGGEIEDAQVVEPTKETLPWPERRSLQIVCALLLVFPLFFGGNQDAAVFAVQVLLFGSAGLVAGALLTGKTALLADYSLGTLGSRLAVLAGIFSLLVTLQLLVLPLGILELVSGSAADLYARAGAAVGAISVERAATLSGLVQFAAFTVCGLWLMALPRRDTVTSFSAKSGRKRVRVRNQLLERARKIDSAVDLLQRAIVLAGVVFSVIALGHLAFGSSSLFGLFAPERGGASPSRAHWPFVNPNHMAVFLEIALMTAFARLLRLTQLSSLRSATSGDGRRFTSRVFQNPEKLGHHTSALLGVFVMLLCGILTLSRMGGTLLVLGMVLLWAVFKRNQFDLGLRSISPRRRRRHQEPPLVRALRKFAKPFGALLVVLLVLFFAGQSGRDRLAKRIEYGLTPNVNETRVELNFVSLEVLAEYPLLGIGLGNWHRGAAKHVSRELAGYRLDYAHNEYLQLAAELGAFGLLVAIVVIGSLIAVSRRALRSCDVASDRMLLWGSAAAVALPLVHSTVDFPLHIPGLVLAFVVALAIHVRLVDRSLAPEVP